MATNNRPLKAYVRYDGSGRAVSSSLIWRKNKPKVGNWKEVQGYECCEGGGENCLYGASFYQCIGVIEPVCDPYTAKTYYLNYDIQNNIVCTPESMSTLIGISIYEDINKNTKMPNGVYLGAPLPFRITVDDGIIVDAGCA